MNNLLILFKNQFNILLGSLNKRKKQKSFKAGLTTIILTSLLLILIYGAGGFGMIYGFRDGLEPVYILHCTFLAFSVTVILGTARLQADSKHNDTDFLLSLPITRRDIVLSKLLFRYITDLYLPVVLFGTYMLAYFIVIGFSFKLFLTSLIFLLLMPLCSIGLSQILDYLFFKFLSKFKNANIIKTLIIVIVFIPVLFSIYGKTGKYGAVSIETLNEFINSYVIVKYFYGFIYETSLVNTLITLGILVVPFILGTILSSQMFGKTVSAKAKNNAKEQSVNVKTPFAILIKKEITHYLSSTVYMINTIIGPILYVGLSIYLAIKGFEGLNAYLGLNISQDLFVSILVVGIASVSALTTISACSVSLEGKNLWIIKSMPIDHMDIINSKSILQIIVVLAGGLLGNIIISIFCHLGLVQALVLIVLTIISAFGMAYLGTLINLYLPNFDWDDEARVVKQGMSVLVYMLSGLGYSIIPILLLIFVHNSALLYILLGVYYLLFFGVVYFILKTKGRKLIDKL